MNPRRVSENDLRAIGRDDALNGRTGGLGLIGDDGDFRPHERIQQRRFARIGPAENGDEPRAEPRRSA